MEEICLKTTGAPSLQELESSPGFPDKIRRRSGPVAFIECIEEIPCNPCEDACPNGAITVGRPITNLPVLDSHKCSGCRLCVAACPGLAIYVKDYTYSESEALISFPYEYYPLPQVGDAVEMVDRLGNVICKGRVVSINLARRNNRTPVVSAAFPKEWFDHVVSIKRLTPQPLKSS